MKKWLMAAVLVLSIFTLAACEDEGYQYPDTPMVVVKKLGGDDRIVRDVNTGCMYYKSGSGIMPYYDKAGRVMGCGNKTKGADLYK